MVTLLMLVAVATPKLGVVNVGEAVSALELTAVWMLSNSVLISVPLTIFKGSPEVSVSLVAKLVDFV